MYLQPNVLEPEEFHETELMKFRHICECGHGIVLHDYEVINPGLNTYERMPTECRYHGCSCVKFKEQIIV